MALSSLRILDAIEQLVAASADAEGLIGGVGPLLKELRRRERSDVTGAQYAAGRALLTRVLNENTTPGAAALKPRLQATPAVLEPELGASAAQAAIDEISEIGAAFCALGEYPSSDPAFHAAIKGILAWETSLAAAAASTCPTPDAGAAVTPDQLQAAIRAGAPEFADLSVGHATILGGGLSKTMALFEAESAARGRETLVARIQSSLPILEDVYKGMDLWAEYHLLRYVHARGVKTPAPVMFIQEPNAIGRAFFVSERVRGSPGADFRLALKKIEPRTVQGLARVLASLHRLPVDLTDADLSRSHLARSPPATRAAANRAFIQSLMHDRDHWGEPASPLISTAVRFLLANAPGEGLPPTIIHGDCGLNNVLIEDGELTALLDWEAARLGDPAEDVAWLLYLTDGVMDRAEFMAAYVEAGGDRFDDFTMAYMSIVQRLKLLFVRDAVRPRYERLMHARPVLAVAGHVHDERTMAALDAEICAAHALRPARAENAEADGR